MEVRGGEAEAKADVDEKSGRRGFFCRSGFEENNQQNLLFHLLQRTHICSTNLRSRLHKQ